jgi:hypothetical protein
VEAAVGDRRDEPLLAELGAVVGRHVGGDALQLGRLGMKSPENTKSPESANTQSAIIVTWSDLLTDGPERECCGCVVPGGAEGI